MSNAIVSVNGVMMSMTSGEMVLDVLRRNGVNVPTLCHVKHLLPSGACRLCLVEIEGRNGLVPACATEVTANMVIKTHTAKLIKTRKMILELLLANHPDDCLFCERNGECELQNMARELQVDERIFKSKTKEKNVDRSSCSIIRDNGKCILCGRCVRVCEEIMGVSCIDFVGRGSSTVITPPFGEGMGESSCVNCGQCIKACPTGALYEKSAVQQLMSALENPDKYVVVQHAPSISVTIGEYFGIEASQDVAGQLNCALRKIGFDKVFDTSFAADLTIMEEASEFIKRLKSGKTDSLPMFTSCSPGWIKFVEQFFPQFIPNLSTCKSPQQMLGSIIKNFYAERNGIDPQKIVSVAIMPCTAKKFEIDREEMRVNGLADVDIVLTTRELAKVFKMLQIDLSKMPSAAADDPFEERSSAGKIFGVTGGVMEAAIRTAFYQITGKELPVKKLDALRTLDGIKEASIDIDGTVINVAVVSGLVNARKMLEDICAGRKKIHFMEVMTCPGGCIAGGGQPRDVHVDDVKARMNCLYQIDSNDKLRVSHKNISVKKLYDEFLGEPLGKMSHKLLHTVYKKRQ